MTKDSIDKERRASQQLRARILSATAQLIASQGVDGATTRAVAAAAGVQAPTIYRLFGDKQALLAAVASDAIAEYVASKAHREVLDDPVEELRKSWHLHVAFCLENPHLFAIMEMDPQSSPAAESVSAGLTVLRKKIHEIARKGRLCVAEERAVTMVRAAGVGTVMTLLGQEPDRRDKELPSASLEAVISSITIGKKLKKDDRPATHAIALSAALDSALHLSLGERQLMRELLARIAEHGK